MPILAPPFRVKSIHFAHGGRSSGVPLKDPDTGTFLGDKPEWRAFPEVGGTSRNAPAAFVGGEIPVIRVVLQLAGPSPVDLGRRASDRQTRTFTIRADETDGGIGVPPQEQEVSFDSTGMSAPLEFRLSAPLPAEIGRSRLTWHWIVEDDLGGPATHTIGLSDHDLYTLWKSPLKPVTWEPAVETDPPVWAWQPVVEWTCEWAAGANSEKAICDALIANAYKSGLKYGMYAYLPKAMFAKGGGMCAGFYRLFQAMAGCHGVAVLRRTFLVNWPDDAEESKWCAIVVTRPGLNRDRPAQYLSLFHDVDRLPTTERRAQPRNAIERRYRFWGSPWAKIGDGHCINFLKCSEGIFLYDSCFMDRAVEVDVIPKLNIETPTPVASLGLFKSAYLDQGIAFMLGSLNNGDTLFRTVLSSMYQGKRRWRNDGFDNQLDVLNGLTVPTKALPAEQIDFYWDE